MPSPSKPRRWFRTLLFVLALGGAVTSFTIGQRLHALRQEIQELSQQVGYLAVRDESQVHIAIIPSDDELIPPGVEQAYVWRFRVFLPANFGLLVMSRAGAISADSPRARGGGGSGWRSGSKEPVETTMTVSLLKTQRGWMLSRMSDGSSGATSLPQKLDLESMQDMVIEPVTSQESGPKSFDVNEPICLLRIRGKEQLAPRGNEDVAFYPGIYIYMAERQLSDALEQWAQGKIDEIPEDLKVDLENEVEL